VNPGIGPRLARDHQAALRALAGDPRPLPDSAPQRGPRRPISRRAGLFLVRVGRRLAGPDELLDRRLAAWSRTGWQRP
jgi:hypothetical protein